jgi:glycosyltransferase involved in cell wall biosynthesis
VTAPSVLFLGLATYSRVGGLQNFNRRVIANLGALVSEGLAGQAVVHLVDDSAADLPQIPGATLFGFGRDRLTMIARTLAASRRADVLLVGHINLLSVAWMVRMLRPGLRIVLFVHGDEVWNDALRARRPHEPWMLRSIDQVASVSTYTAQVMGEQYRVPADRFVIFPNAIDDFVAPPQRVTRGRRILCVTRIGEGDRRKHVDQLIRALAVLRDRGRPATLTHVGDGALRGELEGLARDLSLDDQVRFAGRVTDQELARLYAEADAFALPSSKEGFGIVYLEAWSYGLPVMCGARGAPHEIIEDGVDGRIANDGDVADIADKLDDLLSRPDAVQMGQNGLNKVRTRYLNANALDNLRRLISAPR